MESHGVRAQTHRRVSRFASTATRASGCRIFSVTALELMPTDNVSGGYTTTNSHVRSGRVFNLSLADLQREYPIVETWNSCMYQGVCIIVGVFSHGILHRREQDDQRCCCSWAGLYEGVQLSVVIVSVCVIERMQCMFAMGEVWCTHLDWLNVFGPSFYHIYVKKHPHTGSILSFRWRTVPQPLYPLPHLALECCNFRRPVALEDILAEPRREHLRKRPLATVHLESVDNFRFGANQSVQGWVLPPRW
jgi:hypothetical protein